MNLDHTAELPSSPLQSPSSPKAIPLITPPIIPSTPYYMTPPQIIYLTTPCCNINTVNNMSIVHPITDAHTNNDSIPLSFPSLNYPEPRSNTPESDQHSIISTNTVNTANTNTTNTGATTNTTLNNTVLTSFSINDINDIDVSPSKPSTKTHSEDDEYHVADDEPMEEDDEDEDIDIYITTKHRNDAKKRKKKKKKRKKSKKRVKKRTSSTCEYGVLPAARGHGSIGWSDLCETKLQCHICDTVYADRTQYIDCLKTHYHDKDNDLVYLECELCLAHPTKQSLERKERLLRSGIGQTEPSKWRQSKHVANFISHIAGHKGMNPGFYCKVRVWDNSKEGYVRCGAPGSTLQNLAKHVYNMHYKLEDVEDKYCVDPTHGYCEKSKLKKLHKNSRNSKKKTCGTKRKRRTKKRTKTRKKKEESESEYAFSEDSEHENVAYRKKRKINGTKTKKTTRISAPIANDLLIPEAMGHQCWTLQQQNAFLSYLWFAAAPELTCLADYVCDYGDK